MRLELDILAEEESRSTGCFRSLQITIPTSSDSYWEIPVVEIDKWSSCWKLVDCIASYRLELFGSLMFESKLARCTIASL